MVFSNPELVIENSPIPLDNLVNMGTILAREKAGTMSLKDKEQLIDVALNFVPAIHTLTSLGSKLEENIVKIRKLFRDWAAEKHA